MNAPTLAPSTSALPWLEMFGLGVGMCLILMVAVATAHHARAPTTPLLERLLSGGASGLIGSGLAGTLLVALFPPRHYDPAGHLIGEMPPEFGLCTGLVWLGLAGALCVLFACGLRRWIAPRREQGPRKRA